MLRIGLTGGTGAGKSSVAARLAEFGAEIIDADAVARHVVEPGTEGLAAVLAAFGPAVLDADGGLDRAALGRVVFADADARRRLNAILHPLIAARTAEIVARLPPDAIAVHDVPLLVENGLAPRYHLVIVVDAEPAERVRRLVATRGLSEAEARQRIAAQADHAERVAAGDVWIDNNATRADLTACVDRVWSQRLTPYAANLGAGAPASRPDHAVLVPHREEWAAEARRIMARIGTGAAPVRRVDHIGSTAVPGLAAKDVIDVQVVVEDVAASVRLAPDLAGSAGLIRMPGEWWDDDPATNHRETKVFLRNADPCQAVNCHVRVEGSTAWREALLLRDWLRARPDAVREYTELKHRLAAQPHGSVDAYADAKSPWIRWSLERAGRWAQSTGWSPG